MRQLTTLLVLTLFMACNTNTKKETATANSEAKTDAPNKKETKAMKSADYSTLLTDYTCSIEISELAAVLQVSETALSLGDHQTPGKCTFNLNGFGKDAFGGTTRLMWGPFSSSKAQNKKEISSFLKRKKEGLKIMGLDIELAETGDCYLAYQPAQGRMIIYNGNYDQAFLINYGQKNANTDRTKEQHEELRLKMTDLANYLLKKNRK